MGKILRFTHKKCGFELDFLEGVGFALFKMQCEARAHMRNGDWGEPWQELIKKHPDGTATINKALCYCEKCKKYFAEPRVVFYIPKEGHHYEFGENHRDTVPTYIIDEHYQVLEKEVITCPNCDSIAVVMESVGKIPCPICGEMRRGRDVGLWD